MVRIFTYIIFALTIFISFGRESTAQGLNRPLTISDVCDNTIQDKGIAGNAIRCIAKVVNRSGDILIREYFSAFSETIFYVTIVAILAFGIRVMFGLAKARGMSSWYIAKILVVLFVTNPANSSIFMGWRDGLLSFSMGISGSVLESVDSGVVTGGSSMFEDLFDRFDEITADLLGAEPTNQADGSKIFLGIAALIGGLFFTGPIGSAVTMVSIGFIFVILIAMVQAVLFFSTIIIALNFLMAIAPLCLACMLFDSVKRIATQWFDYVVIYTVQPILFITFLGMTLGILDQTKNFFMQEYESIKRKSENVSGNSKEEVVLFDCEGITEGATKYIGMLADNPQIMAAMESRREQSLTAANLRSRGTNFNSGFTDSFTEIFKENCQVAVSQLKVDQNSRVSELSGGATNFLEDGLTPESLRELMGRKIALIALLIMLIAFLHKIPTFVDEMVGRGVYANIIRYAHGPTDAIQSKIQRGYDAARTDLARTGIGQRF